MEAAAASGRSLPSRQHEQQAQALAQPHHRRLESPARSHGAPPPNPAQTSAQSACLGNCAASPAPKRAPLPTCGGPVLERDPAPPCARGHWFPATQQLEPALAMLRHQEPPPLLLLVVGTPDRVPPAPPLPLGATMPATAAVSVRLWMAAVVGRRAMHQRAPVVCCWAPLRLVVLGPLQGCMHHACIWGTMVFVWRATGRCSLYEIGDCTAIHAIYHHPVDTKEGLWAAV